MKAKPSGNPDALRSHKEASQQKTRQELEYALARLRNGNPKRVKRGSPITVATVAEEAAVDRSTLYRYHKPVLAEIWRMNEAAPKKLLMAKQDELAASQANAKEYREMLEAAQVELTAWARQNYALTHRNHELERLLAQRDKVISDLHSRLNEAGNVVALRVISSTCSDLLVPGPHTTISD